MIRTTPSTPIFTSTTSPNGRPRRTSESFSDETNCPLKDQHHFPFKLYDMLAYAADSQYSSAVSWLADGRAFAIHDEDMFLEYIVPMFFKQTKFRSFTRQLNLWCFVRLPNEGHDRVWQHEHFIRGRFEILGSIQRVKDKNNKPKTKTRQSKNGKLKQRQTIRILKSLRTEAKVTLPADSSTDSRLSTAIPSIAMMPVYAPLSRDIPENVLVQHHITPDEMYQSQARWSVSDDPCQQPSPAVLTSCYFPVENQSSSFGSRTMDNSQTIMHHSTQHTNTHAQQYSQTMVGETNEEEFLSLLSGIFEPDESSHDDDLSSILSGCDVYEDYMNPFSL